MSRDEIASALGISSLHFCTDIGGYHIVILFSDAISGEDSKIDDNQKRWLQDDLARTSLQTLVFIHHSLADQDLTGNFWFEQRPHHALVANRIEIRDIFEKSGKVLAVFNGHVHWNRMDIHNGIPYFNITSIVENFKNDDTPSESFAVVDLHHESITVDIRGNDSAHFQHSF